MSDEYHETGRPPLTCKGCGMATLSLKDGKCWQCCRRDHRDPITPTQEPDMDIVFKAAVRCGEKTGPDKTCGKEIEWEDLAHGRDETAEHFANRAMIRFQERGWLVEGKKCRCPDHS